MTIDLRAYIYSSLGPVISGEISDSYVVDTGLVFTTGSCVLAGIFRPELGTVIRFSYAKGGNLVSIPRRLRVMSSFADPLRRQTTLQLGCPLTYKSEMGPAPEPSNGEDDDEEIFSCEEATRLPRRKSAAVIFRHCCDRLGINVSGSIPLTNSFLLDEFDYSAGYVQVMNDLLKSEGYLGYIKSTGDLEIISLDGDGGTGPVLDENDIIDISAMNSGDMPADSVAVSYNAQTLRAPDPDEEEDDDYLYRRNWEFESTNPNAVTVIDRYKPPGSDTELQRTYTYIPWSWTRTTYDSWDRVALKFEVSNGLIDQTWRTTTYEYAAQGAFSASTNAWWSGSNYLTNSAYLGAGLTGRITANATEDECTPDTGPPDGYADVVSEEINEEGPLSEIAGACGFPEALFPGLHTLPRGRTPTMRQITTYDKDEQTGITKTRTIVYKPFIYTPEGAHSIGARANNLTANNRSIADALIDEAKKMVLFSTETKIRTEREFGLQVRPSQSKRLTESYARDAPVENSARLTYAIGGASSQSVLTLSVPYSCDDYIAGSRGSYTVIRSDAREKARRYGRIQNRLLLGSNSGISIQLDPDSMPSYPFKPIYIRLSGLIGQYRTNAQSWAFDSQGIISSCDALFWGAAGGS